MSNTARRLRRIVPIVIVLGSFAAAATVQGQSTRPGNRPGADAGAVTRPAPRPDAEIPPDVADLFDRAMALYSRGRHREAIPLLERFRDEVRRIGGEGHPAYSVAINNLSQACLASGDRAAAGPLLQEMVTLHRGGGLASVPLGVALNNLGGFYEQSGAAAEAEQCFQEAADVFAAATGEGERSPYYAMSLTNLANLHRGAGRPGAAEALYRRALDVYRAAARPHPNIALCLNGLAEVYADRGNDDAARPLLEEAAALTVKAFGERHPHYAACLNRLGRAQTAWADYAGAERTLGRALQIQTDALGDSHPEVGATLFNLAEMHSRAGDFAAARAAFERGAPMRRAFLTGGAPDFGRFLTEVATGANARGDYATAESLYKLALAARREAGGENSAAYAAVVNDLGMLYLRIGNYAAAEPLLARAVAINRGAAAVADAGKAAERRIDLARTLNNLGLLYKLTHRYKEAEPLYEQSLEIRRAVRGDDHLDVGVALNNLAALYENSGRMADAGPLLTRALEMKRKAVGEHHSSYAQGLHSLAHWHSLVGDHAAAEPLYLRAMEIRRAAGGENSAEMVVSLTALTVHSVNAGKLPEALAYARRAAAADDFQRENVYRFASEREQEAYWVDSLGRTDARLTLCVERVASDPEAARFAAEVLLRRKGAMLQSLADRQATAAAGGDETLRRLFDHWQAAGRRHAAAALAMPPAGRADEHRGRVATLAREKEAAEQAVARASARYARQGHTTRARLTDVSAALGNDAVLVEFGRYFSYTFRNDSDGREWGGMRYVAVVIKAGAGDAPDVTVVPLGTDAEIRPLIAAWRGAVSRDADADAPPASAAPPRGRGEGGAAAVRAAGEALAARVWKPLSAALGGRRKVYLAPDGDLAFVSFAALPGSGPGRFLIDDCDLAYVESGRDLLRSPGAGADAAGQRPMLVGAPDYEAPAAIPSTATRPAVAGAASTRGAALPTAFKPLAGALAEVRAIEALVGDKQERPLVLTGAAATEGAVRTAARPRVLHLATHGFFLAGNARGRDDDPAADDDAERGGGPGPVTRPALVARGVGGARPPRPDGAAGIDGTSASAAPFWLQLQAAGSMSRAGVALAGANLTLAGRSPPGGDDGILTADEVAAMDLWGTTLVTISACESGLGQTRGGEGVYGLRRAFALAGARHFVLSLWSVDDESTRRLMVSMYGHLAAGRQPSRALLDAQRKYLDDERKAGRYPHPFYWAAFVASGSGPGLQKE